MTTNMSSLKELLGSSGPPGFLRGVSPFKANGLVKMNVPGRRIGQRWEPTRAPTEVQDRRSGGLVPPAFSSPSVLAQCDKIHVSIPERGGVSFDPQSVVAGC